MSAYPPPTGVNTSIGNANISTPDSLLREHYAEVYPQQIWYFFAVFLVVVASCQLFSDIAYRWTSSARPSPKGAKSADFKVSRIPLAIVNGYRVLAFRYTIGVGAYSLNIAEVLCLCSYIAALFTWELVNTTSVQGGAFTPSYMSSRAGAIAVSQLPFIAALGTKNNLVGLITGLSHDKLNLMHRMCARVTFVMLWLHGGLKLSSRTSGRWGLFWLQLGLLSLVSFSVLVIVSLRPIRERAYEIFFYSHFVLVLLVLIGGYYHVEPYHFNPYIYSTFIIWGLDRVIRLIRLAVIYLLARRSSDAPERSGTEGYVDALSLHLMRLRIKKPQHFHWSPGQTVYLILPEVSTFPIEAHPFTIASYDDHYTIAAPFTRVSMLSKTVLHESSGSEDKKYGDGELFWNDIVFLINVRQGFTKRLWDKTGPVKVFLDGPYGTSCNLSGYDALVLVAGGSGVSYTLPLLLDAIDRARSGKGLCKRVVFIWAIRDSGHIHWIADALSGALYKALNSSLHLDIQLYITQGVRDTAQDNTSITSNTDPVSSDSLVSPLSLFHLGLAGIKINYGRPVFNDILMGEAERTNGGRMGVSVCGSRSLAQAVKVSLRYPLTNPGQVIRGGASVVLHVESFGYA